MKSPPDPTDPLLQCLADEAADLLLRAANEARNTRARHMHRRRQFSLTVAVLFLGVFAWQVFPPRAARRETIAMRPATPETAPLPTPGAPTVPEQRGFVKVQTEDQVKNDPLPLPDGLSQEQETLLFAARGLPLLLVRDDSGKVTGVHVIER